MKIQKEKIELQKKVHRKTCVTGITFLVERPASYVILWSFFWLFLPFYLLRFYTEEKILLKEIVVGEVLAHPASQCLRARETKEGHRLILAVSAFNFHKSWCNLFFQKPLLQLSLAFSIVLFTFINLRKGLVV